MAQRQKYETAPADMTAWLLNELYVDSVATKIIHGLSSAYGNLHCAVVLISVQTHASQPFFDLLTSGSTKHG